MSPMRALVAKHLVILEKKKPPRRAASAFVKFKSGWLEEDHATSHEHIQILEALVDPVEVSFNGQVPADEVAIELKVLPIEPEMHRRRVDFLDDARAPAVDRGIGEEHLGKSRASLLRTYAALGEGIERARTQGSVANRTAADIAQSARELMLVLPTFAKEYGCAERSPSPPDTSLHVPNIGAVRVGIIEHVAISALETSGECSSVVVLVLI